MITKEEYDKLNYMQQEAYLIRCPVCQMKREPYPVSNCCEDDCYMCGDTTKPENRIEISGRKYCSDECLNEFMLEKD